MLQIYDADKEKIIFTEPFMIQILQKTHSNQSEQVMM